MKKQESYNILCNGRVIYKDLSEEDLMDTMDDLSQQYYETGVPKPEDIMVHWLLRRCGGSWGGAVALGKVSVVS